MLNCEDLEFSLKGVSLVGHTLFVEGRVRGSLTNFDDSP